MTAQRSSCAGGAAIAPRVGGVSHLLCRIVRRSPWPQIAGWAFQRRALWRAAARAEWWSLIVPGLWHGSC